ncbi:DUF882 domain-containing protein [Aureimonas altamirensis]|uniref:DUF882 domain-containing protein n=1 Tax=Aureimonas altamirensis TaxID=370622 RepID=UPI002036E224|nr:DUF882 domain-containing protein [Aureimonas altamirensis]MCM2503227.1 DUF882 domain-containing protein [Aureimonas altamirensis]
MLGNKASAARRVARAATILATGFLLLAGTALAAKAETRTLKLYHVHLREKTEVTYKRNGRFLPEGLKKANWALRDWRENKPTNMDPALLDIMWEAQRQSGTRGYIQILGGFRSPKTNNMLRSRSSGVAGGSLHMSGKAIDFYMEDVPLRKLREIGLRMQVGGVGYYPRSGSPFVHFDSGKGRYWPRMSRSELAQIFPRGNTIYLPADGKPLPGYDQAVASYNQRKGASGNIQMASASETRRGGKSLIARLFGGGADEAEDNAEMEAAPAPARRAPEAPRRAPAPQAPAAPAAPAEETLIAAVQPTPAPRRAAPAAPVLSAGVAMPDRPQFDTSSNAPRPAAGVPGAAAASAPAPAETPSRADPPSIAVASIPMPQAAPARATASAAEAPTPAPTVVAAAVAREPASAAGELAYAVPTPSRRPFEAVLQAAAATDAQARTASAEAPTPSDAIADTILKSASKEASDGQDALSVAVAFPTHRPDAGPVLEAAADAAVAEAGDEATDLAGLDMADAEIPAGDAIADILNDDRPAPSTVMASLETGVTPSRSFEDIMARIAPLQADVETGGKGGRVGSGAMPRVADQSVIASRIAGAAEVTRPLQVADADPDAAARTERLSNSSLVVNVPLHAAPERFGN